MILDTVNERSEFQRLVTDLFDYRDLYSKNVFSLELLTSDPVQVFSVEKSTLQTPVTTSGCRHDNDLRERLTLLIRQVVEASDSKPELITAKLDHALQLSDRIQTEGMSDASSKEKALFFYGRGRVS